MGDSFKNIKNSNINNHSTVKSSSTGEKPKRLVDKFLVPLLVTVFGGVIVGIVLMLLGAV